MSETEDIAVGPEYVAQKLSMRKDTVTHLARKGKFPVPGIRLGELWRWPKSAIDALARGEVPAEDDAK